jgi:large subunit ribosomal protein L9
VEVILLEKIRNLGILGDKVKVKPGFARNYLIPQGKAVFANEDNIVKFEQRRAELEKLAAGKQKESFVRQDTINALGVVTIVAKAGDEGKLFGSIGTRDIADAINKTEVLVEKREVRLPEGPLRTLGEHEITIELESDILATIKVNIVSENLK